MILKDKIVYILFFTDQANFLSEPINTVKRKDAMSDAVGVIFLPPGAKRTIKSLLAGCLLFLQTS